MKLLFFAMLLFANLLLAAASKNDFLTFIFSILVAILSVICWGDIKKILKK